MRNKVFRDRDTALFSAATSSANPRVRVAIIIGTPEGWEVTRGTLDVDMPSAIFFDDSLVWTEFPIERTQNYFGRTITDPDDALSEIRKALG